MSENWKPVVGYEDCYEVSDRGRVRRSFNRFGNPSGRTCRPSLANGYARYVLSRQAETITKAGHRMVWEAFVGPIPHPLVINHKNGVKDDNRLENLEVVTVAENTAHGFRVLGRRAVLNPSPGSKNGRARISERDIPSIRARIACGETDGMIAKSYSVSDATIWQIRKGNTWRHVA